MAAMADTGNRNAHFMGKKTYAYSSYAHYTHFALNCTQILKICVSPMSI